MIESKAAIIDEADKSTSSIRKERNINAIGIPMYETLVRMAREGADIGDILMRLLKKFARMLCSVTPKMK